MKNRLARNWIAVSIIWVGALIMTYLNTHAIKQIRDNQTSIESMRMDDVFMKNNVEKITRVIKQRAGLFKTIDSLQIEILTLRDMLGSSAKEKGLTEFQLTSDPTTMRGDRITFELQALGKYRDMVFWLQALENEVPYLLVTNVQVEQNRDGNGYRFNVKVDFRFTITSSEMDAT